MGDFGLFIALATVLYLGIMMIFWRPKKYRQPMETKPIKKEKLTPADILDVLEFMKAHNIIDNKTYNELIVKSAPFL